MDKFVFKTITTDQAKDSGMAAALICLLIALFTEGMLFYSLAILALLVNMVGPRIFVPWAKLWMIFSHLIGSVMSRVILSLIYAVMVIPVGFFRNIIGKDPMQLKKWKQNRDSVFRIRDHEFTADDFRHPY